MKYPKDKITLLVVVLIFLLILLFLFITKTFLLPKEFYSSFAGALVAILFSTLISFYLIRKQQRTSKDSKAQIIQTLLSEIELNMNNIANFIKGCREGSFFQPFIAAFQQKSVFWAKFLTEYPYPSFTLTQNIDLVYSSFLLMQYYAVETQNKLPENFRFVPITSTPLHEQIQDKIKAAAAPNLNKWKLNIESMLGLYDKIIEILRDEFKNYKFEKQLYYENNNTYQKLKSFYSEI